MNFFLMNKYSNIHENVLYNAKNLYELIQKEKHIDKLFNEYAEQERIMLNLNVERVLYLSLTFLYSLDLIEIENNMVKKVIK